MRTVIVGCGYVGLELGRQLAAEGHDVVGVRRSESGLRAVRDAGLRAVRADATEPESLSSVPDADVLLAGRSSDSLPARSSRGSHCVRTTLLAVDDEPVWKPDLARWLAEECGVEPPAVEPLGEGSSARTRAQKRCSNRRLHESGYEFAYPTVREGLAPAVAARRRGEPS